MHNTSDLEADGLHQQKTTLGYNPVGQEQKSEAAVGTGCTNTGQLRAGKTSYAGSDESGFLLRQ